VRLDGRVRPVVVARGTRSTIDAVFGLVSRGVDERVAGG
jgi:hypothetical protein